MDCVPEFLKPRQLVGMDVYRADPFADAVVRLHADYVIGISGPDDVRMNLDAYVDDGVFTQEQADDMFLIVVGGHPFEVKSERMPNELYILDGLVGLILEWIVSNMNRLQPEMGQMAAIATVAAALSRRVCSETGDAANLYQVILGPSGSGKDFPLRAVSELLIHAGGAGLIGTGSVTGPTAALTQMQDSPAILFPIDEIGKTLSANKSRNAQSYESELITFLLKAWSSPWATKFRHKGMSDKAKNIEICCPHVSFLGASTPQAYYGDVLDSESLADGFMSRIITHDAGDTVPPLVQVIRTPPPADAVHQLRKWIDFQPAGETGWVLDPRPKVIPLSELARRSFHAAIVRWDLLADRLPHESGASAYRRCAEHARKYALIRACSERGPDDEFVIEQHHADWAIALISWLTGRMLQNVQAKVVASKREKDMAMLVEFIKARSQKQQRTSMSDIARKFRAWDAKYRMELVNGLIDCGELVMTRLETKGREAVVFGVPELEPETSFQLLSQE